MRRDVCVCVCVCVCFLFGHAAWLARFYFPNQGCNLGLGGKSVKALSPRHWASRKLHCMYVCVLSSFICLFLSVLFGVRWTFSLVVCAGFLVQRPLVAERGLWHAWASAGGSVAALPRLWSSVSAVVVHELKLSQGMWGLPGSPALAGRILCDSATRAGARVCVCVCVLILKIEV